MPRAWVRSGENTEPWVRRGGGEPVLLGTDGSGAGGEHPPPPPPGETAAGGWGGAAGLGLLRYPGQERSGWVCAWTWPFHPLPGSNVDTSQLWSCSPCTRWNGREGAQRQHPLSASPASHPRGSLQPSRSGLWPCPVPFRALGAGRGEEAAEEAKYTEITGGKGRVNLYQAYSVSATYCCSCIVVIQLPRTTARPEHLL